jgi:hypothetical protein
MKAKNESLKSSSAGPEKLEKLRQKLELFQNVTNNQIELEVLNVDKLMKKATPAFRKTLQLVKYDQL